MTPDQEITIIQSSTKYGNLDTYLRNHNAVKGEGHTHTRIGDKNSGIFGGSYNININEWEDFMQLYYQHVIVNGNLEYLTEKQLEENGPIMIDIDLRYASEITSKQHTKNHVVDALILYADKIMELVDINEGSVIEVFVMEKKDVNMLENKTKDGLHIIIGIQMHKALQVILRQKVLPELKNIWDNLPVINDWNDILDEGVTKGICNWQLYGSRKPAHQAYMVKYHFQLTYNEGKWSDKEYSIDKFSIKQNLYKLSARYTDYPSFPIKKDILPEFESVRKTYRVASKQLAKPAILTTNNVIVNTNQIANNELVELLDMIDIKYWTEGIGHYMDWLKLVLAIKVSFPDNYKEVAIAYSKRPYSKTPLLFDEEAVLKALETEVRNVSVGTIYYYAKLSNPYAYDIWFIKNKKYLKLSILKQGENDVAKYIVQYLNNKVVYCNKHWWVFDIKLKVWRIGDPEAIIISEMQRQIDIAKKYLMTAVIDEEDEEKKKTLIKIQKEYDNFRSKVGGAGFCNQVIKCLKEYSLDIYFEEKLDVSPYKVAYRNGILDLKTLIFNPTITAEDFLTDVIPYDYEIAKEAEITWVRNEIFKICNCNMEHFNYYLSFLGYAMTGDSSRIQAFFNMLGQKASNGKSIIFEALMKIIPNYIKEGESNLFECNYGSRHKEIATWRGKRIFWINELTKKKQDADLLKKISDGTSITYQVMYGINNTMSIGFKIVVVSNNTLKLDGDNGIARRLKTMQMNSDFSEDATIDNMETKVFVRDEGFKEKLQTTYKHALMGLIYQYSKQFVDDGYKMKPLPQDWAEESKNIVAGNNKFQEFFDKYFIADINGKCAKKIIEQITSENNLQVNIKDELMKMRLTVKYNSQAKCTGSGSVKGVWEGIREKTEDEKKIDENEEITEVLKS